MTWNFGETKGDSKSKEEEVQKAECETDSMTVPARKLENELFTVPHC